MSFTEVLRRLLLMVAKAIALALVIANFIPVINQHMKVRVYFSREIDPQVILKGNKISGQALNTIYELVWEVVSLKIFLMWGECG